MGETWDQVETSRAHYAHVAGAVTRDRDKLYGKVRSLENAIKKHARGNCECKSHAECLTRLVALTPVNDRPTMAAMRREARKRLRR